MSTEWYFCPSIAGSSRPPSSWSVHGPIASTTASASSHSPLSSRTRAGVPACTSFTVAMRTLAPLATAASESASASLRGCTCAMVVSSPIGREPSAAESAHSTPASFLGTGAPERSATVTAAQVRRRKSI